MNKNVIRIAALSAAGTLLLASCDHKELCFDHDPHALKYQAEIQADYLRVWEYSDPEGVNWQHQWPLGFEFSYESLNPAFPKGLRASVYNEHGANRIENMETFGGYLPLASGRNDILFYNNDTEYIVFSGMDALASATATTRSRTRPTYKGSPFVKSPVKEQTVSAPDMLYGSSVMDYYPEKTLDPVPLKVHMTPLVFTYYIRFEFSHGLQYVALARGAFAGVASGVNIYTGETSENQATIMFDAEMTSFGSQAFVRSFGAPGFPNGNYGTRGDAAYGLNLEVKLRNGKIKTFDFDISEQMKHQPQGGVIVVKGLEITDEEGKGGSSGFDVDVDDWGEYEDIPLNLK